MALDNPSNPNSVDGEPDGAGNGAPPSSAVDGDDGRPAARLPRWTRQEILVLIQGKSDAESRFKPGRGGGSAFGSSEPKWALVSSYCKKHGVNREPVQCRKRWSNLAGDYKKIKEWESQARDETESFWLMRNDLRRERKLPGYFDREVYDILDSPSTAPPPPVEAPSTVVDEEVHLYDSNRRVGGEDGLFSDCEKDEVLGTAKDVPAPVPISEKQYQLHLQGCEGEGNAQGGTNEKQPASNPEMGSTSQGGQKRKRCATDGEEEILQSQLIDVLEKNGKMLRDQLEAQNMNFQLDRQQQKDTASTIVAVLDKLADALGRIADKL
ncbi:trihelix transcription factor ASR3-like isoform X1 [Abrus precatorius]|uniref:Trihelix transcription factor ASR3-like isoform X1 n=1 Tax=Abrus precatorius TaxID=3816 RepID=A0A8B8L763_ABRPR|nr:trihelix transcription factor ASR3-like isoform X1 [Abrus precatorius]